MAPVKFPRYVLNRAFDDGFGIGPMNKDAKIAFEAADELDSPMLIGSAVGQVWRTAVSQGYGSMGHTTICAFIDESAGGEDVGERTKSKERSER